ncbi:hypothetical protein BD560DRAFT_422202 [Blakeslea trispora]|nr:hypothetical protein BD560DRAFT_422202 [Blakeslea trispora]
MYFKTVSDINVIHSQGISSGVSQLVFHQRQYVYEFVDVSSYVSCKKPCFFFKEKNSSAKNKELYCTNQNYLISRFTNWESGGIVGQSGITLQKNVCTPSPIGFYISSCATLSRFRNFQLNFKIIKCGNRRRHNPEKSDKWVLGFTMEMVVFSYKKIASNYQRSLILNP